MQTTMENSTSGKIFAHVVSTIAAVNAVKSAQTEARATAAAANGHLTKADKVMITTLAGLNGDAAREMHGHMDAVAKIGREAVEKGGHKGNLSPEQIDAIAKQAAQSLEFRSQSQGAQKESFFGMKTAGAATMAGALLGGTVTAAVYAVGKLATTLVGKPGAVSIMEGFKKGSGAAALTVALAAGKIGLNRMSANSARQKVLHETLKRSIQVHAERAGGTGVEAKVEQQLTPTVERAPEKVAAQTQAPAAADATLPRKPEFNDPTKIVTVGSAIAAAAAATKTAQNTGADKAKNWFETVQDVVAKGAELAAASKPKAMEHAGTVASAVDQTRAALANMRNPSAEVKAEVQKIRAEKGLPEASKIPDVKALAADYSVKGGGYGNITYSGSVTLATAAKGQETPNMGPKPSESSRA